GVRRLFDILGAGERIVGTGFAGAEAGDLVRDLGATWTPEGTELLYVRSKVVFEARAAGKDTIVDGGLGNLHRAETLVREPLFGKRLGFTGRAVIHPRQVLVVNRAYTPTPEEVRRLTALVEAFRQVEATGHAAVRHEGRLVDYAMVKDAER